MRPPDAILEREAVAPKRATDRPTFTLELRPEPGVNGIQALRGALKLILRRFGLRAVSVRRLDG